MRGSCVAALLVCGLVAQARATDAPAVLQAKGFGALAEGGEGGKTLVVDSLADEPGHPQPGTLRWAVEQRGPRIVRFAIAGNIRLKAPLRIKEPFLTIDGSDAPGLGICICDHSLALRDTHDIIVRYIRIRRGDVTTLRAVKEQRLDRPKNSADLDCVSIDDSRNILFDHVSLSWSCDEIFGIVGAENVTVQWCLLAEPLSNPRLHPYGDNHAYGINTSASTVSVHHCLFAHYVMRGPQFEANDVTPELPYDPKFEAMNNVLFDYQSSGSRYTAGIEHRAQDARGKTFAMHFVGNMYLHSKSPPEIQATLKHGITDQLRVYVSGNIGPNRRSPDDDEWAVLFAEKTPMRQAPAAAQAQVSAEPLFISPAPITTQTAEVAMARVLAEAGCSHQRDAVDIRILNDVRQKRTGQIVRSQDDVGGWPRLDAAAKPE